MATTSGGKYLRLVKQDRVVVMATRTDKSNRTTRTHGTDRIDKSEKIDRRGRSDI